MHTIDTVIKVMHAMDDNFKLTDNDKVLFIYCVTASWRLFHYHPELSDTANMVEIQNDCS